MKLVLFNGGKPGVLKGDAVVDISGAVALVIADARNGQEVMASIIANFERVRPAIEQAVARSSGEPLSGVKLLPPLPRPGKILACIGNYKEGSTRPVQPIDMFLKSPESINGPEGTIVLPEDLATIFHHEAELGIVIGRVAKNVRPEDAFSAIFGYTCFIDVSGRGLGRTTTASFLGKSFDTFTPIGPCIVTRDEIPDPQKLHVQLWVNGQIRHDYNTDDMEHQIPEIIEWASRYVTLNPGDIIACGTNHQGLGPLQDGERCEIEISGIGRMGLWVRDDWKRTWPIGVDEVSARRVRDGSTVSAPA
ncbi:MAG: fumarylacetoacetate hydrolase family protein [Chloroflexi bacterium]|nr:fumarylacetoacetate hydrolase family protein [Chloroflexota bacterium]